MVAIVTGYKNGDTYEKCRLEVIDGVAKIVSGSSAAVLEALVDGLPSANGEDRLTADDGEEFLLAMEANFRSLALKCGIDYSDEEDDDDEEEDDGEE